MIRKNLYRGVAAAFVLAISAAGLQAVELPNMFGSHMVIQRDIKAPVWGTAAPSATVTVEFAGQKKTAVADANGGWIVRLDPMKANSKPQTMTVSEPPSVVTYEDVLVGDNWLCSGQSNMEFALNRTTNAQPELAQLAKYPNIRCFCISEHVLGDTPLRNVPGRWDMVNEESARRVTAVGYFFARKINTEMNVPIGLIQATWGGNRIEPFTTYAGWEKEYLKQMEDWLKRANLAVDTGEAMPSMPLAMDAPANGRIYNGMIAPLAPYGIKGALWYQGEANGNEGMTYFQKTQTLLRGWRRVFGVGDFPFYFVQLANYQEPNLNPEGGDGWAKLRDAQRKSLEIPNTGMAVAIDLADAEKPGDIHPKNKQDVGGRLAQWALYQTYGKKNVVPSGPLFKSAVANGNKLVVSFDWVGGGLIVGEKVGIEPVKAVKGGKLKGFAIAGEDKKWVWADAVIDGKTVLVSSPEVPKPVAVRYAFSMNPQGCNLYNKDGMPASPFRSDDW